MDELLSLSRSRPNAPEFRAALVKSLGQEEIKTGIAFNSNGPDFIWAVETPNTPTLVVGDQPVAAMRRITGTDLWFHSAQLRVGTSHRFHYLIDRARFGGSCDIACVHAGLYARPGVPQGRISEKLVHRASVSRPGNSYWIWCRRNTIPPVLAP